MKKIIVLFLAYGIILSAFLLAGCQLSDNSKEREESKQTVIELNENNFWKYLAVSYDADNLSAGAKGWFCYNIQGALDFALYEDVVFSFEVIYYTDGQSEDDYQSYIMKIGCNAAGDATFETGYLGLTDVMVGKLLDIDGELVSFENCNWKVQLVSVTGKVIYTR